MGGMVLEEGDEIISESGVCKCRGNTGIICILGSCLFFVILALIMITVLHSHTLSQMEVPICTEPRCYLATASVLSNIDPTTPPCRDFYQYACGGFVKRTYLTPADVRGQSVLSQVRSKYRGKMYEILTTRKLDGNDDTGKFPWKAYARDILTECIGSVSSQNVGISLPYFLDKDGGKWLSSQFLLGLLSTASEVNKPTPSNPEANALENLLGLTSSDELSTYVTLTNPVTRLDGTDGKVSFVLDTVIRENLVFTVERKPLAKALEILLSNWTSDDRNAMADELIVFLAQLENFVTSGVETEMTCLSWNDVSTVAQKAEFNLTRFIGELLPTDAKARAKMWEAVKQRNICYRASFFPLIKLLRNTGSRTVNNLAMVNLILKSSKLIGGRLEAWYNTYKSLISIPAVLRPNEALTLGSASQYDRWEKCIGLLDANLRPVLTRLYTDRYFPKADKQLLVTMVNDVRQGFKTNVGNLDWLNANEKRAVYEKIDSMSINVAYPDLYDDNQFMRNVYDGQYTVMGAQERTVSGSSAGIRGVLSAFRLASIANVQATLTRQKGRWLQLNISPTQPNAIFFDVANDVFFPLSILQSPLFDSTSPAYLNFGGIGSVIGHEISHAFDPNGHHVKTTVLSNETLWDISSGAERTYHQRLSQLERAYAKKFFGGDGLTWKATGSDVADMGGLRAALTAFKAWVSARGSRRQALLPGFEKFSVEQLFFLNFAQQFCAKRPPNRVIGAASSPYPVTVSHSSPRVRVIGTLMNSYEFAEAFSCSSTDEMNPKSKVTLW